MIRGAAVAAVCLLAQDAAGWVRTKGEGPGPRYAHAAAWDAKGRQLLLFGGEVNPEFKFLDDLWSYDPAKDAWKKLAPAGKAPAARAYPSAAFDAKSRRLWIFGGFKPEMLDDLWAYDVAKNSWTELSPKGARPEKRDAAALVHDEKRDELILSGGLKGLSAGGELKDTWVYSIKQNQWARKKDAPDGRFLTGAAFAPEMRKLIVTGGWTLGKSGLGSNVWIYDPDKDEWTAKADAPAAMAAHGACWDAAGKRLVVFGGQGAGNRDGNAVCFYDPAKDAWSDGGHAEEGRPEPRGYLPAVLIEGRRLAVFGGVQGGFAGKNVPPGLWLLPLK